MRQPRAIPKLCGAHAESPVDRQHTFVRLDLAPGRIFPSGISEEVEHK